MQQHIRPICTHVNQHHTDALRSRIYMKIINCKHNMPIIVYKQMAHRHSVEVCFAVICIAEHCIVYSIIWSVRLLCLCWMCGYCCILCWPMPKSTKIVFFDKTQLSAMSMHITVELETNPSSRRARAIANRCNAYHIPS